MKIDCGLCDKTFDDGLREITCPHNLLPFSTVAMNLAPDIEALCAQMDSPESKAAYKALPNADVAGEYLFTPKPIPGREFSDWPIDEAVLARSIYEDGLPSTDDIFRQKYVGDWSNATTADVAQRVYDAANKAVARLYDNPPRWNLKGFPFGAMEFRESDRIPHDEIWLVDRLGVVHKIINIGNALHDVDAISLCTGEMK